MNKFSYLDYKKLLRDLVELNPTGERGINTRLAKHMQVHTTYLTHVLKGKNQLSNEQAMRAADFFSFTELETEYFVFLLQWNRAGDQSTKKFFQKRVERIREQGFTLKEQLKKSSTMSHDEQAVFYSDWTYSAVRLASALPEGKNAEAIAKMLSLPHQRVAKVVDFLLRTGLCKIAGDRLTYNVFSTYVDASSPFSKKLHDNWRLRSIQYGVSDGDDLMYTSAVTLTKDDFLALRDAILEMLKKFEKVTDDSEPKLLAHLNIDWLRVT